MSQTRQEPIRSNKRSLDCNGLTSQRPIPPIYGSQTVPSGPGAEQHLITLSNCCGCPATSSFICFGTLCDVVLSVRHDPCSSSQFRPLSLENESQYAALDTIHSDECFWVKLPVGEPFACFSFKFSQIMRRMTSGSCIEFSTIARVKCLEAARTSWRKLGGAATMTTDINLYGHDQSADMAARTLSIAKLFLQPPSFDPRSLIYSNPQYLKLPDVDDIGFEESSYHQAGEQSGLSTMSTTMDVEEVFDHLTQPSFLREVQIDHRMITPLVRHQKEAVDFMTRRETGDLPPSLSLWRLHAKKNIFCYKHVITSAKSTRMDDIAGGILADDMGLGKTLSTLALIVGSLHRALNFANAATNTSIVASKATLVVVPSALLLDSWCEEISKHIRSGTLAFHRYHSLGRKIDLLALLKCDLVLTTYATVAAEFCRGNSILDRIEWHRIVLDEAHVIRNPSTKQFRAIRALRSPIRWCLTGTPIQNGLEDFGALVRFLRVPILEDVTAYRKHVTSPAVLAMAGRFTNLRRLLEALCLRRTKSLLNMPDPTTETRSLQLNQHEAEAYTEYTANLKCVVDLAVSGHSMKKANQHVVEALLRLRLFCNHGLDAFSGKGTKIDFPDDPEEALSLLQTTGQALCTRCDCDILSMYQDGDKSSGVFTRCHHLVCGECLPCYRADIEDNTESGHSKCPTCGLQGTASSFLPGHLTQSPPAVSITNTVPTKLQALLSNVKTHYHSDKCVIFSFWKKTLDIVADLFIANNISFCRIHGSLPAGKRSNILCEFESNPSIRALLITFGTGAVGINRLVVANRIHIIEPQWNPSIESQAIGRLLRLGQEKTVTVVRYIMKETVEEAVQSRQLRKLQLARGGFGSNNDEHAVQRIQEIVGLLCPSERS